MTTETEQIIDKMIAETPQNIYSSLLSGIKFLAPIFAPAVLLVIVGTLAFSRRKIPPILRIILIILSLVILAWMWIPILK